MSRGSDERVVKALTVRQPWATDIVQGCKTIEIRNRRTRHRGPLAIHAAASPDRGFPPEEWADLPLGALVGMVQVVDCRPLVPADAEGAFRLELTEEECEGMWAWILAEPGELIEPIPMKGNRNIWHVPPDAAAVIMQLYEEFLGRRL